jgi:hypothetical protein
LLEAADLVQAGISKRVAIFTEPPNEEEREFIRRGVPYLSVAAGKMQLLRSLGVTDFVQISKVDGSEAEGLALPQWCDEHQFGSIIVVATKDHSRRLQRVLDRAMKGHLTRVIVQPARYSSFDPDRWWKTRGGIRTEIIELQKLLLDFVLHPISLWIRIALLYSSQFAMPELRRILGDEIDQAAWWADISMTSPLLWTTARRLDPTHLETLIRKERPKPTRSRWREAFARQLAATLKETAPEQRISNFECICDALRDRAENGNIKAIKLIFQYLIVPDIRQGIS